LPPEPQDSMNLEIWMADYVIDNNGTLEDLDRSVCELMDHLLTQHELSNIRY
jgi:dephospho-CoA kinase